MKYIVGGFAIFLWGLFMFCCPSLFWELFESWKNAGSTEPSESYLLQTRIGGGICMGVGLFVFIASFFIS